MNKKETAVECNNIIKFRMYGKKVLLISFLKLVG